MSTTCELHCLEPDDHCAEVEAMLREVPGEFCEGDGDQPRDAVRRLRLAYEEMKRAQRRTTHPKDGGNGE